MRYSFAPFLALAIAFIAIGISGQHTFIFLGIIFMILGVVVFGKSRRR